MTELWTGILGGLVGSTLTVVITKVLDIFQKRKEHQYNLERTFFERKLDVAETTMTQYGVFTAALTNFAVLFDRFDIDNDEIEDLIQDTLLQEAMKQIEIVNNSSFIVANSITLYFDLESEFLQNKTIQDFYNSLSAIGNLLNNVETDFENYEKAKGTEFEKYKYKLYLGSSQKLKDTMNIISANYYDFNDELVSLMEQIRKEMKKFEYKK